MRNKSLLLGFATVLLYATSASGQQRGGTPLLPNGECPAGMTEVRPNRCQKPQLEAPSILDYRPRSTLVVPAHKVPRAKYPVIDFHGHISQLLASQQGMDSLVKSIDALNVRVVIAADDNSGAQLKTLNAAVNGNPKLKGRVALFAGINFNGVGSPGWADRAVAQLRTDVANGAVGIGEIGKELGLTVKKADGTRLRIDDPELDPVWQEAARLGIPVFVHTADPQEFFRDSIDFNNERWLELALFPSRRWPPSKYPTFDELMLERNNMFKRNPKTTFVAAHMGWHANDLQKLGKMFDEMPNVYSEMGAVLYDIGRQPRTAHDFFIKYQDRILFGKDSFQPDEYPYYWRVFETTDDYFDYYRNYHAFWKLYGIGLPDDVLKKVYYANALKITKGVVQTGWPK
jgi:predicted TIM-barrel fold metal-dependent hydrolase